MLPVLAGAALLDRRSRRLSVPLAIGAVGMLGLVAFNATARYQNWRYATPSLLLLLVLGALGVAALARGPGGRGSWWLAGR